MRRQTGYILTDHDFEVKQKIGVLLELLGEDFEIICSINGYLDQPASDALDTLNYRVKQLQKETGNYGPYLAEPIGPDTDLGHLLNKVDNQMKKKGVKVICKRK